MVKYEIEWIAGVWMRTHGAHLFDLPDLAHHASGHDHGQEVFDIFTNVLSYLMDSGATFAAGHTMQVGEETFMKLREPTDREGAFLDSPGELFVADLIPESEINS